MWIAAPWLTCPLLLYWPLLAVGEEGGEDVDDVLSTTAAWFDPMMALGDRFGTRLGLGGSSFDRPNSVVLDEEPRWRLRLRSKLLSVTIDDDDDDDEDEDDDDDDDDDDKFKFMHWDSDGGGDGVFMPSDGDGDDLGH